jgi:hypothetical protein
MRRCAWTFLLGLTTLSVGASNASAGQFRRATYYQAGQRPYNVVAAQFTQSGNLDLAIANYVSNQVCILLGNGDGTFKRFPCFSAPFPIAISSGDFDEDGNQDLAVVETSSGEGSVAIFLGDGAGHFKLSATYRTGVAPSSVAAADFSGNGHLDLAVANNGGQAGKGSVMVFAGTGKGTFNTPVTYKIAGSPWGIAAGDLNADHSPGLAVTNIEGYVAVLLNDGTGHFGKPVTYNAGNGEVVDVKIVGLRHDGRNDLVLANNSRSSLVVLLNKGHGTFGSPALYPVCPSFCQAAEALVVADFNLDGKLDVAVAGHIGDSSLYYGKGDGTFKPAVRIHNSIGNFQNSGPSIAAGDFVTGNKAPDLAIPIELSGKVAIMINTQ